MGAGGSLPNNFKSQEPPPLPPPFYTGNPSRVSGISYGPEQDRRTSGASTLGSPGFQNPRCSSSMKNEEWWHHRPSAQSLSGLRPQQETLLTYAGEMTGWRSSCESGMPSMHQEAMELSRTVSHLAAANQQLASAHTTLLGQLESLYLELNRERELRLERDREVGRGRITSSSSDYENEGEKLSDRVANLEATMGERAIIREAGARERKLRKSHDETPKSILTTKDIGVQSENSNDRLEFRLRSPSLETNKTALLFEPRNFGKEPNDRISSSTNDEKYEKSHVDNDLSLEYKKAVDRIESLEHELTTSCVDSIRQIEASGNSWSTRMTESRGSTNESKNIDQKKTHQLIDPIYEKDFTELLHETERLRNENLQYLSKNETLMRDLEDRGILVESLKRDCQNSRSQSEKLESSLCEMKKQFDALITEYESASSEKTRLSEELQMFNFERDTANLRIADLEKELADLTEAKERISIIENRESSRLKKMLSEEMRSRREQAKSLEEALLEIQRLNQVIESNEKPDAAEVEAVEVTETESSPEEEEVSDPEIAVARTRNMEEFRKELSLKREARQRAIAAVSSEMDRLRRELDAEKEAHSETSRVLDLLKSGQATNVVTKHDVVDEEDIRMVTKEALQHEHSSDDWRKIMKADPELDNNEADARALADILKISDELKSSIRLQTEKVDDLRYHLECETENHKHRIASLKEIAKASRESSSIREHETNKLKNLLAQIFTHLGDPRFRVDIQDDVRSEHDRQIDDIRRLKSLYDDRLRILVDLRETACKELKEVKDKLKYSWKENRGLEEDLKKAEEKIDCQDTEISNLESQLGLTKADCRDLQNQMSVINGLFTQMLLSASSADMDLDRLTRLLQENHDLISDMAREEGTEAAALPKLLLDIVEQVEGRGGAKSGDGEGDKKDEERQEENIAHNLPKVWRVLLELLSCHDAESSAATPASLSTDPNSCYKSVDTPSGPRLVISVSKTYIRLKELILEKKHLEKEMNRMKTLNTHLESKLGEQEKRLSTVSSELNKTWNIVGRMQAQHQQLHTHEKILRYELQQKRKMLQELKQELEYCREKWESARQKNTNTEIEWRSLRREFAARKSLVAQDSFNNSAESGFSDERGDDSDEEDETLGERVRLGPRRRARKDNPRAPTPDTESEQPTDTELSESKTTPETNVSTEDVSIAGTSANSSDKLSNDEPEVPIDPKESVVSEVDEDRVKPINKLDQALTNVIENLIIVDRGNENSSRISVSSSENEDGSTVSSNSSNEPEVKVKCEFRNCQDNYEDDVSRNNESTDSSESLNILDADAKAPPEPSISTVSVFSIGPFPSSPSPPSTKSVQFSDPLIVGPSVQAALPVFGEVLLDTKNFPENTEIDYKACSSVHGGEIEEKAAQQRLVAGPSDFERVSGRSHEEMHVEREKIDKCVESCSSNHDEKSIGSESNKLPEVGITRSPAIGEEIHEQKVENCVASGSSNLEDAAGSSRKELPELVSSSVNAASISSPSTSDTLSGAPAKPARSHEEVLAARAARLRRLEEQADWLMKKMNATSRRGSALCNRLEELHEVYGEAPVPPPMPDVLPTVRIPLETRTRQKEDDAREKSRHDKKPPPADSP